MRLEISVSSPRLEEFYKRGHVYAERQLAHRRIRKMCLARLNSFAFADVCDVDAALYVAECRFPQPSRLGQYERLSAVFTI